MSFSGSVALFRDISFSDLAKGQIFGNFQHIGDNLLILCYSKDGIASDNVVVENNFGFNLCPV